VTVGVGVAVGVKVGVKVGVAVWAHPIAGIINSTSPITRAIVPPSCSVAPSCCAPPLRAKHERVEYELAAQ
jgi:hypothetical protein